MGFCFIDYTKAFDCVDHNKLWKILKEMIIPDHLSCFLRNLCAGQEATVRTGCGTTDCTLVPNWEVHQSTSKLYTVTLYLTYMTGHHAKCQAGRSTSWNQDCQEKISTISDITTLRAGSEEEWKSLLIRMKDESEKAGLKLNIQKTKFMASGLIISISWQIK